MWRSVTFVATGDAETHSIPFPVSVALVAFHRDSRNVHMYATIAIKKRSGPAIQTSTIEAGRENKTNCFVLRKLRSIALETTAVKSVGMSSSREWQHDAV